MNTNRVPLEVDEQKLPEVVKKCSNENNQDNKMNSKKTNLMKVVFFLLLLSLLTMLLCASTLTILKYVKTSNKYFFSALDIFLYSLIPVAIILFIALVLFIVVKHLDRSHKNINVSKNGDDKIPKNVLQETIEDSQQKIVNKDSEDLVVNFDLDLDFDFDSEVTLQKTEEDLQQELLEQKRQIIRDNACQVIMSNDTVDSTDDSIDIKKDLIKAICCGDAYTLHALYNNVSFDRTKIVMTPFRGIIPLDLAITLGDHNVVGYLMKYAYAHVVSRRGDEGEQVIKLSEEYGNPEIQEMVKQKCQLFKDMKHSILKHLSETANNTQRVSLDEVSSVNSESKNESLSLNSQQK